MLLLHKLRQYHIVVRVTLLAKSKQDAVKDGRLRPGAAIWRTRRKLRVFSYSAHSLYYVKLWRHNTGSTLPYEKDRATVTVTYTEYLLKFGRVVFEICERTDRQTDTLIAILHTHAGSEIKIIVISYLVVVDKLQWLFIHRLTIFDVPIYNVCQLLWSTWCRARNCKYFAALSQIADLALVITFS